MELMLRSAREVIEALGGVAAVSRITGCSRNTVYAWRNRLQQLPPKTYVLLTAELTRRRHRAPPKLWGMIERSRSA